MLVIGADEEGKEGLNAGMNEGMMMGVTNGESVEVGAYEGFEVPSVLMTGADV